MTRRLLAALLVLLPLPASAITIYAAASLTNALQATATAWKAAGHDDTLRQAFASSATLARQIEAGAPADIYASADKQWMDYLDTRGLIEHASRRDVLGNTLVLVAPASEPMSATMRRDQPPRFEGPLCLGDPASVPAGIYARQAFNALGWWPALAKRVVATEDVRTALAFVERGECRLGVVYATDARISTRVMVAGEFPEATHAPVVYPFALLPGASPAARAYFTWLLGPEAASVFRNHGFRVLRHD